MKRLTLVLTCILGLVACYAKNRSESYHPERQRTMRQQCSGIMDDFNRLHPVEPSHSAIREDEYRILRDNIRDKPDTIVFLERSLFHDLDGRTFYLLYAYSSEGNQNLTMIDYSDFVERKRKERMKTTDASSGICHILPKIRKGQYTELQNLAYQTDTGDDDIIHLFVILKNGNSYHLFKHLNIPNPDYLLFEREMNETINK